MSDVAVLGLQVDSRPVAAATTELNKLAPAARAAEQATGALEAAAKRLGVSTQEMQGKVDKARAGINPMAQAADVAAKSHNRLSFEAKNLSYQLVDVTQGVLMGQSAFQIMAQQGGQLAQVIATSPGGLGGLMRELGRGLVGMLTPARLAIGLLGGLGVAAYAMNAAWKTSALQFDDTARAANTTLASIRALTSQANVKGIEDFGKDAEKFAGAIYQARNGMGSLGDLLRANGERATTFEGTLQSVARILQRAGSDQQRLQLLQQAGLPATMQWVRFLQNGGTAIQQAAAEAAKLSPREQELIDKARQFDEAWAKSWGNFKTAATDAVIDAKAGLRDLLAWWQNTVGSLVNPFDLLKVNMRNGGGQKLMGESDANDFYGRFGSSFGGRNRFKVSGPVGPAVDPAAAARALALEQQRLGLLGQTISVGHAVRLVEIQIAQARLQGVSITEQEATKLKELARERALGTDQIRAQTNAYNIDAATVGMSIEKAAAYAAVQERLNEARRNGQVLTAANIAEIEREAGALGRAAANADDMRFKFDTFSSGVKDFASNLRQGQNAWTAFGNAANSVLNKIIDRLLDMASRQLWSAAFGGGGSGINIGSLLGLGGGGGPSMVVGGAGSMAVPTFAKGGAFRAGSLSAFSNSVVTQPTVFPINDGPIRAFANGTGLMGEAGPEAIMPLSRGSDGKLGVRSQGGAGGSVQVNVYNAPAGTTASSTQRRTADGGTRIDVMLKRTVDDNGAALINSGESQMNQSLEKRYGLVPKL